MQYPQFNDLDSSITKKEMEDYGYTYDGMYIMRKIAALQSYVKNEGVYLLYPDNTEALAENALDILRHDGLFGVEFLDHIQV